MKTRKESYILYLSMFVMGGCGLAYEYTLSKVASDILGNSPKQWALIIGVMMFFMGIGSDMQKYFGQSKLLEKFISFEILLGLIGAFGPMAMLWCYGQSPAYYILVQYFFIGMIGLLIGFEIPLLTRINESYTNELKVNVGGILKMDYVGALCGALAWIFILPLYFTMVEMAFVLGVVTVATAIFTMFFFNKLIVLKKSLFSFAGVVMLLLCFSYTKAQAWTSYAEQYLYKDRIVSTETTPYQHIVVTKSPANDISCYINGHLQFNSADEFIYHENLVHPIMHLAPRMNRVLVLGGGDGLAVREILKYKNVDEITVCDIDPRMTELAKSNSYFVDINEGSLKNARTKIIQNNALVEASTDRVMMRNQHHPYRVEKEGFLANVQIVNVDAAKFVEQVSGVYDIIIIDFPDPNMPDLSKLYSKQFYQNVKRKLALGGLLVQQSTSPVHAKEAFLCVGRTMKAAGLAVVPYHDNVPSFGEWGWWFGGRAESYSEQRLKEKVRNIKKLRVSTRYLSVHLIKAALLFGKNQLETDFTDINTVSQDKIYEHYLKGWRGF